MQYIHIVDTVFVAVHALLATAGVARLGERDPSSLCCNCQKLAIPSILSGKDTLLVGQTGELNDSVRYTCVCMCYASRIACNM